MLLLTIVILFALMLASYAIFDRDILAPPTVVSLGLLFSALCAFYNEKKWNLAFSSDTTWVIVTGVAAFLVGGMLALVLVNLFRLNQPVFRHTVSVAPTITIDTYKTVLLICFQLVTVVVMLLELKRLTGGSSWVEIVSTYRTESTVAQAGEEVLSLSGFLRLLIDVCFVIAFVYAYVVGNQLAIHAKQSILHWIPLLLSTFLSFMQGYRSDMLRFWIAILVVAYTLRKRSVGWANKKETSAMIKKIALSVGGIAVVFIAMRGVVGRKETDWDPLYYLTFYAGSPVAALDLFLKSPLRPSEIWGKETFYHLNQSIGAWFERPELRYIFYKEYRQSPNGTYIGNVYTALRPAYYDFGYVGMLLVMLLMGIFFTFLYCKVRDRAGKSPIDLRLLLYAYIAYTFFMYFYNCYNNFISFGFVRLVLELIVMRWFLLRFGNRRVAKNEAPAVCASD